MVQYVVTIAEKHFSALKSSLEISAPDDEMLTGDNFIFSKEVRDAALSALDSAVVQVSFPNEKVWLAFKAMAEVGSDALVADPEVPDEALDAIDAAIENAERKF